MTTLEKAVAYDLLSEADSEALSDDDAIDMTLDVLQANDKDKVDKKKKETKEADD